MNDHEILTDIIQHRRSVRRFLNKPVVRETLDRLVEAASWAPSAGNRQDWLFTVVTSSEVKEKMAKKVRDRWAEIIDNNRQMAGIEEIEHYTSGFADFSGAPVIIVVSSQTTQSVQRHLLGENADATVGSAASAAMAAQNLMLAAHAFGLGSCCMTGALAARREIAGILDLGKRHEPICLIALGYADEKPVAPTRKTLQEIVRYVT